MTVTNKNYIHEEIKNFNSAECLLPLSSGSFAFLFPI